MNVNQEMKVRRGSRAECETQLSTFQIDNAPTAPYIATGFQPVSSTCKAPRDCLESDLQTSSTVWWDTDSIQILRN